MGEAWGAIDDVCNYLKEDDGSFLDDRYRMCGKPRTGGE